MHIANLPESTQSAYLFEVERLARHYGTSAADQDGEQLRDWVLKPIDRGLSPFSTNSTLAAHNCSPPATGRRWRRVTACRPESRPTGASTSAMGWRSRTT